MLGRECNSLADKNCRPSPPNSSLRLTKLFERLVSDAWTKFKLGHYQTARLIELDYGASLQRL